MFQVPNYTSSPIIKQNYTSQAGLRLKNLSHLLSERFCQTPNALSNRVDYSAEARYFASTKSRSSASLEPYKRHHSYINQADVSSSTINEKENTYMHMPGPNKAKYLKACNEMEENSLEEKTYFEESNTSSIYRRDRSTDSQDVIQKQDSFYMRFSNIKLKTTTLPTFQELELAANEDRNLGTYKPVKTPIINHKYDLHTKKISDGYLPKHVSKPSVPIATKKPATLPYQTPDSKKGETYRNLFKKTQANKASASGKENRPVNVPQKTPLNIYQRNLKRCFTATHEKATPVSTATGAHTTKASMTGHTAQSLRGLLRGATSGRESAGTSRGNKTLFIGNQDPLRLDEKSPQLRATFVIPGNVPDDSNSAPYTTKRERREPFSNHMPQERVSAAKISHSPLRTLTDRSFSNPKLKVHRLDSSTPSLVQPKPVATTLPQNLKDLKFDKILGQGAYAVVKLAQDRYSGRQVAVKTYEKVKLRDPAKMRNVKREIALLKEMNHSNVIKLHTSLETPKQIHLVMEYVGTISLQSYLKSKTSRKLEESEAKRVFRQLCQGISYCHNKNIVHRDIKLENILLDDESNVKVIDFGFSICIPPEKSLTIFCGTPSYMSPEIVSKLQYKGCPSDVWALGVVLYALLCGRFPFRGMDEKELFGKIKKGKYEIPSHVSVRACELLQKIFKLRPEDRLTVQEILEDPWVRA